MSAGGNIISLEEEVKPLKRHDVIIFAFERPRHFRILSVFIKKTQTALRFVKTNNSDLSIFHGQQMHLI